MILEISIFRNFPQKIVRGKEVILRSPSKVYKTIEKKLSFHQNGHRIQENDLTKCTVSPADEIKTFEAIDCQSMHQVIEK